MDEPLVCCILPYHIPDYLEQAVECFERQSYKSLMLIKLNTSGLKLSIGAIRNQMCEQTPKDCLIAHLDHDDWSAPDRITQQAAVGAAITGYHDLPFYDVANDKVLFYDSKMTGYAVGTSLMYRREVWERTLFPDQMCGEDQEWQHAVKRQQGHPIVSTSSLVGGRPMMIARHHAGCVTEMLPGKPEQPRSLHLRISNNYKPASPELDRAVRSCLPLPIVAQ